MSCTGGSQLSSPPKLRRPVSLLFVGISPEKSVRNCLTDRRLVSKTGRVCLRSDASSRSGEIVPPCRWRLSNFWHTELVSCSYSAASARQPWFRRAEEFLSSLTFLRSDATYVRSMQCCALDLLMIIDYCLVSCVLLGARRACAKTMQLRRSVFLGAFTCLSTHLLGAIFGEHAASCEEV